MAKTESKMLALGTVAPDFSLPDAVSDRVVSLSDFKNKKALVVMFICNHCPFVKHLKTQLSAFAKQAMELGAAVVAINSNDVANYPDDHPQFMKKDAQDFGYTFPYLYDETQKVARTYDAACTPDFYVFNEKQELAYRGQFDASRPGNSLPITGQDLMAATQAILAGQKVNSDQKPSIGCNIKWKT